MLEPVVEPFPDFAVEDPLVAVAEAPAAGVLDAAPDPATDAEPAPAAPHDPVLGALVLVPVGLLEAAVAAPADCWASGFSAAVSAVA